MIENPSPTVSAEQEETPRFSPPAEPSLELLNIHEDQLNAMSMALDIIFNLADQPEETSYGCILE